VFPDYCGWLPHLALAAKSAFIPGRHEKPKFFPRKKYFIDKQYGFAVLLKTVFNIMLGAAPSWPTLDRQIFLTGAG
jgi:hypothetical protein